MPVVFCPLEVNYGNVAEWFAVGVAFLGAVAVFVLGVRAHSLAILTRKLATEADEREARGLLGYIKGEVGASVRAANEFADYMEKEFRLVGNGQVIYGAYWSSIRNQADAITIQTLLESRERVHVLPAPISDVAFRLMGLRRAIQTRAAYLSNHEPTVEEGFLQLKVIRDWALTMSDDLKTLMEYANHEAL